MVIEKLIIHLLNKIDKLFLLYVDLNYNFNEKFFKILI